MTPSGFAPGFFSGTRGVTQLGPWPPVYNNSGSRRILPHRLLKNCAVARDVLTTYAGIALS
eukprot:5733673-Pyramimonas_sp.AAC.1